MPVLITGAEDGLGATTARRLLAGGGEVRLWLDAEVCGDADARAWRAAGCKVALGTGDDEGRLEAALEQVHTVVHAAGGPLDPAEEATQTFATVVGAALGAGCRRLVWVTDLALAAVGDLATPPPYVTALAERAALAADLPMDVVVCRTGLRYGPRDRLTATLAAADGLRDAAVPHAPVWLGDVAGAVATADAQRGTVADVHLEIDVVGPTVVPLGAVVEGLAAAQPTPAGDDRSPGAVGLPEGTAEWLRIPAVGGPDALGRQGTAFTEGLRRISAAGRGTTGGG
jgi:nucleoside-diphosphate-sugar epimerase